MITARVNRDMDAQTSTTMPVPGRSRAGASVRASSDDGIVALSHMLSGLLLYGGLGWLGWQRLGQMWMMPLGLVLGLAAGTYLVYRRYAAPSTSPSSAQTPSTFPVHVTSDHVTSDKEQ